MPEPEAARPEPAHHAPSVRGQAGHTDSVRLNSLNSDFKCRHALRSQYASSASLVCGQNKEMWMCVTWSFDKVNCFGERPKFKFNPLIARWSLIVSYQAVTPLIPAEMEVRSECYQQHQSTMGESEGWGYIITYFATNSKIILLLIQVNVKVCKFVYFTKHSWLDILDCLHYLIYSVNDTHSECGKFGNSNYWHNISENTDFSVGSWWMIPWNYYKSNLNFSNWLLFVFHNIYYQNW